MSKADTFRWTFKPRFRRQAFGWKSQPAIQRIKEAVSEIKKVSRKDPLVAGEGAVIFLERLSPAIEQVDGSSGAIGSAVNYAISNLVPIVADAPVDFTKRRCWLDRLWQAHNDDGMAYLETLPDYWGELCGSREMASIWADELSGIVKMSWSRDPSLRGHFRGATACLSALYRAERYDELLDLLALDTGNWWNYQQFAAKALAAMGKTDEAIRHAESCRGNWTSSVGLARVCEEILLSAGRPDDAYSLYAIEANQAASHLSTFRAIAKKYPHKNPEEILKDLIENAPGEEGKWFATAKELGQYELALNLARSRPCDPRTLTRAARDFADSNSQFALGAGLCALHWLINDYGYEITSADVWAAYTATLQAAAKLDQTEAVRQQIRGALTPLPEYNFVRRALGRDLDLSTLQLQRRY